RLACIRHAASVHPEPGSNSPQKIHSEERKSCYGYYWIDRVVLLPITFQLLRCSQWSGRVPSTEGHSADSAASLPVKPANRRKTDATCASAGQTARPVRPVSLTEDALLGFQ